MADDDDATGTVVRVLRLLRCLAEAGGSQPLKALAGSLALPPSTVHRQLQTLAREGIVEHDAATRGYRAGREFYRIAALVVQQYDIGQIVRPALDTLRDQTDETCFFTMYLPAAREATIIEVARSPHPLQYRVDRFTHIALAWGSLGRSMLAHLPASEIDAILATAPAVSPTGRRLVKPATLRAELSRIVQRGYAMSRGHTIAGAIGIAAAVRDSRGAVVGSIGLTAPEARLTAARIRRFPALVSAQARALSASLGWREPVRGRAPRA